MKAKVELQRVLTRELKAHRWTVNGLARECGIPTSVLHGWLQGVLPSAKNLHHIDALAKRLRLPISVLLFNRKEDRPDSFVLFFSEFSDGLRRYRLSIERLGPDVSKKTDEP